MADPKIPEMVERVRLAIEEEFLRQRVAASAWGPGMGIIPPVNIASVARAAIAALRNPPESVLNEVEKISATHVSLACRDCAEEVYDGVIDAILKE